MVREEERRSKARYPDRIRARKKRRYAEDAPRVRARVNAYYYEHRDAMLEYHRNRYEEHGEVIRTRAAAYRKAHPDKCRAWDAKYRGLRAASGEVFDPVEVFERDGWVCGICHEAIDPTVKYPDHGMASLDHVIPLSRGGDHTRENTQASHLRCNKRKKDRLS